MHQFHSHRAVGRTRTRFLPMAAGCILFAWSSNWNSTPGQVVQIARELRPVAVAVQEPAGVNEQDYDKATIKTDADLESLLTKAQRYLDDGNYRIACRIWQEVLNRCGDTLYSTDGQIYYSLGREVEKMIARLPADGLQTYRISADASATEILAAASGDQRTAALNRVVNEFFLSSLGDDAAFELASLNLDSFDFVGAMRLLRRILDEYPDPSIALDQIWLRVALCQGFTRDFTAAKSSLEKARQQPRPDEQLVQRVAGLIEQLDTAGTSGPTAWQNRANDWQTLMPMPNLPPDFMQGDLRPVFQYRIPPQHQLRGMSNDSAVFGWCATGDAATHLEADESEKSMWDRWRREGRIPAGDLLFHGPNVYYKTAVDLAVWNTRHISDQVVWRPAWLNYFEIDESTRTRNMLQQAYGRRRVQSKDELQVDADVYFFGDRIAHTLTIYRDALYMIEGPNYDISDKSPPGDNRSDFQWGRAPRRTRVNYLTAYDADSGLLRWRMPPLKIQTNDPGMAEVKPPPAGESPTQITDIGFMGPPVGFADLLLCPVNVGGSIYVYALDSTQQGQVVWQAYLTDEPVGGANPWATIQMFLEGSDLYVVCGCGALFVLDPASGVVRYARRYPRTGVIDRSLRELGVTTELRIPDGFVEDLAIPFRNAILVLASDLNMIRAFDRQTGQFLWEAPTSTEGDYKVDRVVGILDHTLYCSGRNEIIAYDLQGDGRMLWTASWSARELLKSKKLTGECCLTSDALYVPLDDSIAKLDPRTGTAVAQVGVGLQNPVPIGNLYSDGRRIWALSANRLIAFEQGPPRTDAEPAATQEASPVESKQDDGETAEPGDG